MSDHTCFEQMNAKLKPFNARISHGFGISNDLSKMSIAYYVQTEKLNDKVRSKKPPLVVMTHCPFCGVQLKDVDA